MVWRTDVRFLLFLFFGSWKVRWSGGTTHPPSFHNSQNSGLWKICGNGTNRSLWHNAFHQKCFRIFNEIHLCFILQNALAKQSFALLGFLKMILRWVKWKLENAIFLSGSWNDNVYFLSGLWVMVGWSEVSDHYILCFGEGKKIRCLRKLSAGRVSTSALSIKAIVIAFIAIALVVKL